MFAVVRQIEECFFAYEAEWSLFSLCYLYPFQVHSDMFETKLLLILNATTALDTTIKSVCDIDREVSRRASIKRNHYTKNVRKNI